MCSRTEKVNTAHNILIGARALYSTTQSFVMYTFLNYY